MRPDSSASGASTSTACSTRAHMRGPLSRLVALVTASTAAEAGN